MSRVCAGVVILALLFLPVSAALAQATPTPTPKGKTDSSKTPTSGTVPPKAQKPIGDFAVGYVETIEAGNPTFVTLRLVGGSNSIRPLKVAGTLRVALTPEAMANASTLKRGDYITVSGVIRDGTFFASTIVLSSKSK